MGVFSFFPSLDFLLQSPGNVPPAPIGTWDVASSAPNINDQYPPILDRHPDFPCANKAVPFRRLWRFGVICQAVIGDPPFEQIRITSS